MSAITLLLLRLGFLALLWVMIFAVVYALRSDLFGQRARRAVPLLAESPTTEPRPTTQQVPAGFGHAHANGFVGQPDPVVEHGSSRDARLLVITAGPKTGFELLLGREPITIGRSSESSLIIRDDYTSTHHARLMLWSDDWVVHDLDSTNGTFLNGTRVTLPTAVPLNTPVRIGTTSFELRR